MGHKMNSIKWLCDEIELEVKDRNEEPENEWEDRKGFTRHGTNTP